MSDHLTPERLADIRGAQREEWSIYPDDVDDLLAHIDAQAATIQRVRDLLIPNFYDRAEANQLLNKIQTALDGGQE